MIGEGWIEAMRRASIYVVLCGFVVCIAWSCTPMVPDVAAHTGRAKATIKMKLLGSGAPSLGSGIRGSLLTDGTRWAAYEPKAGVTRLIDTKTGHRTDRPDPAGCTGGLIAIGGGEMLYRCANPECPNEAKSCFIKLATGVETYEYKNARFMVEDVITGVQQSVAGEEHFPPSTAGGPGLEAIGTQWAKGVVETNGGASFFFVNWHTGEVIQEEEEPPSADEAVENLNRVQLLQPLCKPVVRPSEALQAKKFVSTSYEPPFAIIGPSRSDSVSPQLHRCGNRARLFLPGGGPVQLGGGVLSWGISYVTRLRARAHTWHGLVYRVAGAVGGTSANLLLQHTSTMVFVTVAASRSRSSQIYFARLPWLRRISSATDPL